MQLYIITILVYSYVCLPACLPVGRLVCSSVTGQTNGQWQGMRERDRDRQTDTERQRVTETETERDRDRETETERQRQRDRERWRGGTDIETE